MQGLEILDQEFDFEKEPKIEVLKEGDENCSHDYILYIHNAFDGQAWWCDNPSCERHERMDYYPGKKMSFPPHAYIRTPNPHFGGEEVYSHQADADGIVGSDLPEAEQILRTDLESKL